MTGKATRNAPGRNSGLIVLLVATGLIIILGGLAMTGNLTADRETTISISEFAQRESISYELASLYQPDRDSYGEGKLLDKETGKFSTFRINGIFNDLPEIPDDFWRVKYLIVTGQSDVSVLGLLDSAYFTQPEFIRDTFVESGLNFWKKPDIYHWFPEGYGTYPHVEFVDTYPGASFDAFTFTHSSWGVETYQGFTLVPEFLEYVDTVEGPVRVDDPEGQSRHFQVKVTPNVVLLGPTYPVFTDTWIEKIKVSVTVSPDTPPGIYGIGYDVAPAPRELDAQWKARYQELYQGKSSFGIMASQFQMLIRVQ